MDKAKYWVSDLDERNAVKFLEQRGYIIYKEHSGQAVVPDIDEYDWGGGMTFSEHASLRDHA